MNGVVIGAVAASYEIVALHRIFSGERACQAIFALLIGSHLLVSNFTFIKSFRLSRLRPTAEDLYSYREIGAHFTNHERLLFVRSGTKTTETGEWLTVLSRHNVRPLPQGQEWNGTYGNEIDALNAISRCCEQLSWNCVNDVVARYKLVYDAIVIDQPSCAGILPGRQIGNLQIIHE